VWDTWKQLTNNSIDVDVLLRGANLYLGNNQTELVQQLMGRALDETKMSLTLYQRAQCDEVLARLLIKLNSVRGTLLVCVKLA
jgi:hypothetical protein